MKQQEKQKVTSDTNKKEEINAQVCLEDDEKTQTLEFTQKKTPETIFNHHEDKQLDNWPLQSCTLIYLEYTGVCYKMFCLLK